MNNMRQIGLALLNYKEVHGYFPPPYLADKNGKPMHSWRVLILPYLERRDLFDEYNFKEPWDGPDNQRLADKRPSIYQCPSDENAYESRSMTSYVAVLESASGWQQAKAPGSGETKGQADAASSVLLIETADSGIQWTEPRDLCLDDFRSKSLQEIRPALHGLHAHSNGYFYLATRAKTSNVVLADGQVSYLQLDNASTQAIADRLSAGGWKDEELQLDWIHCSTLALWIISVGLLLYQALWYRRKVRPTIPTGSMQD